MWWAHTGIDFATPLPDKLDINHFNDDDTHTHTLILTHTYTYYCICRHMYNCTHVCLSAYVLYFFSAVFEILSKRIKSISNRVNKWRQMLRLPNGRWRVTNTQTTYTNRHTTCSRRANVMCVCERDRERVCHLFQAQARCQCCTLSSSSTKMRRDARGYKMGTGIATEIETANGAKWRQKAVAEAGAKAKVESKTEAAAEGSGGGSAK